MSLFSVGMNSVIYFCFIWIFISDAILPSFCSAAICYKAIRNLCVIDRKVQPLLPYHQCLTSTTIPPMSTSVAMGQYNKNSGYYFWSDYGGWDSLVLFPDRIWYSNQDKNPRFWIQVFKAANHSHLKYFFSFILFDHMID